MKVVFSVHDMYEQVNKGLESIPSNAIDA